MATALKRIKKHCLFDLNYLVWRQRIGKKPCLGLRFHSDNLNLKCRKIQKRFLFSLIVVNRWSSSILQVEQQKVTNVFPYYSCNVLFTAYMQLVHSLCSFQFRIHCMSALLIAFRITYNWYVLLLWEQDGFVFLSCVRRVLY